MMKVLIAEDDSASNILLKRMLIRWGFDVISSFDGNEAWQILQQDNAPPIAILDWMMPGMEGSEICQCLREFEKGQDRYTYVILLSSRSEKEDIVIGLDAGADDYIIKPFDKEEMRARLRAGQRIIELQGALRQANKRLTIMSRLDPLTGALSRNAILDDLDLAMYRAAREKKSLGISLIDVDNLKEFNDLYGRSVGDRVLQDSVRRINASLRRTDYFGRYGGDEFLVILLGVDIEKGLHVCQRIRKAIGDQQVEINGEALRVTASQSLIIWDGKSGIDELVASAERGLKTTAFKGCNRLEATASGIQAN
ncbi:MAG: Regulator of RpoS [Syntrophus sp. SKADARSKE-3]|nr:Regulator of RpoS [Syntrophus sp. SKADARSKE-3]